MTTQRDKFEAAVVRRLGDSKGYVEDKIRSECLERNGSGYVAEVIDDMWHFWNEALWQNIPLVDPGLGVGPGYIDFITPDEIFDQGPEAVQQWQEAYRRNLATPRETETSSPPGNQIRTAECDGKDAVPATGQLPVGTASTPPPVQHVLPPVVTGQMEIGPDVTAADLGVNAEPADDDEETYQIGVRDGYSQAVQEIDRLTGGDGEYRYCTDHDPDRHTPGPAEMIQRIVDRFEVLNLLDDATKTGRDQPDDTPPPQTNVRVADDLRTRVMRAIFDPGATEGFKSDRDLTTWQTDAVMRALATTEAQHNAD